jgi:hypothetical protein
LADFVMQHKKCDVEDVEHISFFKISKFSVCTWF